MLRAILRQYKISSVTGDADSVIGHKPLPEDARLNGVHGQVALDSANEQGLNAQFAYGLDGYILPVHDPDTPQTYEALWDLLVPKDNPLATTSIDLDTAGVDTASFFDLGEINVMGMLGMEGDVQKIFEFRDFASPARHSEGIRRNAGNTANVWFFNHDMRIRVKRERRVRRSSAVVFGLGIGERAGGAGNLETSTPTEFEWVFMRYARAAVEELWFHMMGLRAAGTGSQPGEEVLAALETWLEDSDGGFLGDTVTIRAVCRWMFDVSVPGSFNVRTLSGGA